MKDSMKLDRRNLLQSSLLGLSALAVPTPLWAGSAASSDTQRKFFANGQVAPFHGNTIVCHLDQQGQNTALFDALLDIYRQLPALRFARKITALPPSSYHMTIFGGANHPERKPGLWPTSIPLDTPIEECTRILGERLEKAKLGPIAPIRMRVDLSNPVERENPFTIRLLPIDEAENQRLRALRNRLSEILEIRSPNHDLYRFHVTLAYLIRRLDASELREFRAEYKARHAEVAERCPIIELGQPEYCSLEDMFHFKRLAFI